MVATLVINTGGISSPFIACWIVLGLFSGIFGERGIITIFLLAFIFGVVKFINNDLDINEIINLIINSIVPLIVSIIIWHGKSTRDELESDDRTYRNLTNELNEVSSKSEAVINAIGDGVIALDRQGNIQLINPAAQQIIGWIKQDALSLHYKSVLRLINNNNETLASEADPIQQVLNNNQQVRENDLSIITKNDKKLMIAIVVSPVGEAGSGVIVVFRDVTKEKAEEREQAEFISTASHEMRTPVASIEGYLGLALNPHTAEIDLRARDYIEKAHASAEHLGRLFQDLLDVSKADDGRISNNPQPINIVTFIHDIVQGLAPKATEKGLKLIYKPLPDNTNERFIAPAYTVNLDNDHVREITNNLIENAIKYTPSGEIVIDVNGNDDHVVISVNDSGIGIPDEDIPHLFQKFYRVDNKDTREIGGTGLGLYLCRRLVEIIGGRIWAESVRNEGSTFYVELPRASNGNIPTMAMFEKQKKESEEDVIDRITTNKIDDQPASIILKQEQPEEPTAQNNVPRAQALTPDQIAAYVAKQRALAQEQQQQQVANNVQQPPTTQPPPIITTAPTATLTRPQAVPVPKRNIYY